MTKATDTQVGGAHYKDFKIQPVEFIHANGLGFLEGCIIKRICRWRSKGGLQDLEKIKHEIDLLIQLEGLEPTYGAEPLLPAAPVPYKWVPWEGGACPCGADEIVEVELRDGSMITAVAWNVVWHDVVMYRIVSPRS